MFDMSGIASRHGTAPHVAPHPLLVPELIAMVLAYLSDDMHSLFSALLVHP